MLSANISFLLLLSFFSIQTLSLAHPLLQVQLLDRVLIDKFSVLLFSGSPNLGNTNSTLIFKSSIQLQQSLVSAMNSTTPFNPYEQSFTLLGADGTPFNVTIPDLDSLVYYYTQSSVNFGAQLGASIVLFIVLLLLTKRDKRTCAIFIINALALAFNTIRTVMFCLYFTGPWVETYAYFGQDYARVHTRDYAESVNSSVFTLLVLVCIDASLCLQTRVVCLTLRSMYRIGILMASILVALVGIGLHFTLVIENCILIVDAKAEDSLNWILSASQIANTISICFFCMVFTVKLGLALRQRKKLGLVQFGPMQVLFIMGCQTLVIPGMYSSKRDSKYTRADHYCSPL